MSVTEDYSVDLLDNRDDLVRTLSTSYDGRLSFDETKPIQRGGKVTIIDDNITNWVAHRLRVWHHRIYPDRVVKSSLGIYIPTAPSIHNLMGKRSLPLEIHDKTLIYQDDGVEDDFYVPYNTKVTDVLRDLIISTGETRHTVTESEARTDDLFSWEIGTPKLTIMNQLLRYINYKNLWVNTQGTVMVTPHTDPASQPLVRTFSKSKDSIHAPNWVLESELDSIPNHVVLKSSGSGSTEGLRGVYLNDDPSSPHSTISIGRVITHSESVEAESQGVIDALAKRRWAELSSQYNMLDISHLFVPQELGDKVRFVSGDVDMTATVARIDYTLKPGSLVNATWRKV